MGACPGSEPSETFSQIGYRACIQDSPRDSWIPDGYDILKYVYFKLFFQATSFQIKEQGNPG